MKTTQHTSSRRIAFSRLASRRIAWRVLSVFCGLVPLALLAGGCDELKKPEFEDPAPVPTKPPKPVFNPEDNITKGVPFKGLYRVREIISAELLDIESVKTDAQGRVRATGEHQIMRVAGIVAPQPGQRGWEGSVKAVRNWTMFNRLNPTVEIEGDSKFPVDLNARPMVQVYFKGSGEKNKDTRYNLGRMLVRSGWAIVDLNVATSIDLQMWLNDEEYARQHNLGLRKYGIILGQRLPGVVPQTTAAKKLGAGSAINVVTSGNTVTSTTSTQRTTTLAPGMPPSGGNSVTAPPIP